MILLIDNNNAFTFTLIHKISTISDKQIKLISANEKTQISEFEHLDPTHVIFLTNKIDLKIVEYFIGKVPILGINHGMLLIAQSFGAKIQKTKEIRHGFLESIELDGKGLFRNLEKKEKFTRYHSLTIEKDSLPKELEITSSSERTQEIMGIRHKEFEIEGILFHPESIGSNKGSTLLKSFLTYRREGINFTHILSKIMTGQNMSLNEAELFMEDLTEGLIDERHISAILTALSAKGPSAEEIAGCAKVLCRKKTPIPIQEKLTDIVGTGGDGIGSFNISSMAALVAAGCGLPIAKHGNRAVSSLSGSADFYEALGIKIDLPASKTAQMIQETGFGFLFAPVYHAAMRYAAPVRKLLGVKTIMNLVGPLSNPANAEYQMLGVYEPSLMIPVAQASKMLGSKRVMVVCSYDGMDEISCASKTHIVEINEDNEIKEYSIDPNDFGIENCSINDLLGGDAHKNAELAMDVITGKGKKGILEAVALNAGASLYISGFCSNLKEGYKKAKQAMLDGSVLAKITEVREASCA